MAKKTRKEAATRLEELLELDPPPTTPDHVKTILRKGLYTPEQTRSYLKPLPAGFDLHGDAIKEMDPLQTLLSDIIRSSENISLSYHPHLIKRGKKGAEETIMRGIQFTTPEYQSQFLKKPIRQRPLPLSMYEKDLRRTLGPQYDYPAGGPTGTTRTTMDRIERRTAADKLYQDLIGYGTESGDKLYQDLIEGE